MPVRVIPTLAAMAEVYRQSSAGGPDSPRFHAYVDLGARRVPVSGYNPMTSKPVLPTVEALLDLAAEDEVERAMAECLSALLVDDHFEVHLTVATPGMWTDRLATEVEHRHLGRTTEQVLWWFDEPPTLDALRTEATAQAVRLAWQVRHGSPSEDGGVGTLADAAGREGLALAMASSATGTASDARSEAAAEALDALAEDESLATIVSVLHGDDAATAMGWTPLGLGDREGLVHAASAAREALRGASPAELLAQRWSPTRAA